MCVCVCQPVPPAVIVLSLHVITTKQQGVANKSRSLCCWPRLHHTQTHTHNHNSKPWTALRAGRHKLWWNCQKSCHSRGFQLQWRSRGRQRSVDEKRETDRERETEHAHTCFSFILEVVSEDRSNYCWHFRGIYCYLARFTVGMKPPEGRVHSFIELLKEGTSVTEPYFHLCVFLLFQMFY